MKKSSSFGKILKIIVISIIIFIVIIALIAIGSVIALDKYLFHPSDKYFHQASPIKNPHPAYFMTVKGEISSDLVGHIHPVLTILYQVQKKYDDKSICYAPINRFEGVYDQRTRYLIYPIDIKKDGHYQLKVPLDYYRPGACDWQLSHISYYTFPYYHIKSLRIISEHQNLDKYLPTNDSFPLEVTIKKSLSTVSPGIKNFSDHLNCQFKQKNSVNCYDAGKQPNNTFRQISTTMNFNWTVNIAKDNKS